MSLGQISLQMIPQGVSTARPTSTHFCNIRGLAFISIMLNTVSLKLSLSSKPKHKFQRLLTAISIMVPSTFSVPIFSRKLDVAPRYTQHHLLMDKTNKVGDIRRSCARPRRSFQSLTPEHTEGVKTGFPQFTSLRLA